MFAYISHRLEGANSAEIKQLADDTTIRALFREGMYNRYLLDGWSHVPFEYDKPDFIAIMKARLVRGLERNSYKSAHLMARLLFGSKEAPRDIDDLALSYIQTPLRQYRRAISDFRVGYRPEGEVYNDQELADLARIVVSSFELIIGGAFWSERRCSFRQIERRCDPRGNARIGNLPHAGVCTGNSAFRPETCRPLGTTGAS